LIEPATDGRWPHDVDEQLGVVLSDLTEVEATRLGDMLRDWS